MNESINQSMNQSFLLLVENAALAPWHNSRENLQLQAPNNQAINQSTNQIINCH